MLNDYNNIRRRNHLGFNTICHKKILLNLWKIIKWLGRILALVGVGGALERLECKHTVKETRLDPG